MFEAWRRTCYHAIMMNTIDITIKATIEAIPDSVTITKTRPDTDTEFIIASDEELEKPYRVIIENDDVTPMEFVTLVLVFVFELPYERADAVMLEAHIKGQAYVTTLPYEDAQQRVYAAQSSARQAGYPLSFYLEPDR